MEVFTGNEVSCLYLILKWFRISPKEFIYRYINKANGNNQEIWMKGTVNYSCDIPVIFEIT